MKKSSFWVAPTIAVTVILVLLSAGCKPRDTAPVIPVPTRPSDTVTSPGRASIAPTVKISANPTSIERGETTVLTWESESATEVTIDNGLGTVEAVGSRSVRPLESTTYRIRATNNVAVVAAEIRVTVTDTGVAIPIVTSIIDDARLFDAEIQDVFFDMDDYSVRSDARQILQANARVLRERPNILITIEGHCDERGSERYNLVLGDRRANAARDYLITLGIAESRIETISYGEERPFCDEKTEECWQLNRRASFVMR